MASFSRHTLSPLSGVPLGRVSCLHIPRTRSQRDLMFDFWLDLPVVLRVVFALALIGIAVLIFFLSGGRRFAIGIGALGLVLLLSSGSGSNKGGYNF